MSKVEVRGRGEGGVGWGGALEEGREEQVVGRGGGRFETAPTVFDRAKCSRDPHGQFPVWQHPGAEEEEGRGGQEEEFIGKRRRGGGLWEGGRGEEEGEDGEGAEMSLYVP